MGHIIERGIQLSRLFARKRFGALAHFEQLLPLGDVLVRGHPATTLQWLAGDTDEPAVLSRPYHADLLSFGDSFGHTSEDVIHVRRSRRSTTELHSPRRLR